MAAAVTLPRSIESLAPFRRSPASPTPIAARVEGEVPSWLRGELVRTCPAVFEGPSWRAEHWFDGLCMLYAFKVGDDGSVAYHSRLLESEAARDVQAGRTRLGSFGTPLVRNLWQRLLEPVARATDNGNVNIVKMGAELVAMTESNRQLVVDQATLGATGAVAYEDDLGNAVMSAHPHFDFERNRVVNVATRYGASATLSIYEHGPASRSRSVVGSWRAGRAPYIHAFGLTAENAILIAHPFSTKPGAMLWSNRPFIEHFAWRPEEGTRLVVIDRKTGATREHLTDPYFVFHTVNAFERDGATVLDLLAYADADVVAATRVDRITQRLPDLRPSLLRLTLRPGVERAQVEKLADVGFEFPATAYRRVNGKDYRFVWGAADGPEADGGYASSLVKIDVRTGRATSFADGEHVYGEPIFVARPGASDEDDGVIVSVGSRTAEDRSRLAIVDAKTMALVASAEVPHAIPLGFHGSFLRA